MSMTGSVCVSTDLTAVSMMGIVRLLTAVHIKGTSCFLTELTAVCLQDIVCLPIILSA